MIRTPGADRDLIELARQRCFCATEASWTAAWNGLAGESAERARDALRPESLREHVVAVRGRGPAVERSRRALRLRVEPYLGAAAAEPLAELDRLRETLPRPRAGFRSAVAREPEPRARRAIFESWREIEDRCAEPMFDVRRVEDDAAAVCGVRDGVDLRGRMHSRAPADVLEDFRRNLIEPGDEAVERCARHRRLTSSRAFSEGADPAEQPALASLAEREDEMAAARVVASLRGVAAALTHPAFVGIGQPVDGIAGARLAWNSDGAPVVAVSSAGGPGALRAGFECLGTVLRHSGIARVHGADGAWGGDPVWTRAWGALLRRLLLNRVFPEWAGLEPRGDWRDDVLHEEWLEPRRQWAVLEVVLAGADGGEARLVRSWTRATGWDPTPGATSRARRGDPIPGAALRAEALASLLEEKLLSRFGWRWFLDRAAGRWITDVLAAEPEADADEVARGCGLGTMDAHAAAETRPAPWTG